MQIIKNNLHHAHTHKDLLKPMSSNKKCYNHNIMDSVTIKTTITNIVTIEIVIHENVVTTVKALHKILQAGNKVNHVVNNFRKEKAT